MTKKRIISLILALILVTGMCTTLFGCANKDASNQPQVNAPVTKDPVAEKPESKPADNVEKNPVVDNNQGSNSSEDKQPTVDNKPEEKPLENEKTESKPTEGKTIDELISDMNKDKQKVNAYLIMGIDKHGAVTTSEGRTNGGQCDCLYLLLVNDKAKNYSILQLDRDTYTEVPVLGNDGEVLKYSKMPLALAHGYGDGASRSCENAVDAVSNLLCNVRIDGYVAMNFEGIIEVNDAVGGVDVLIEDDMTPADPILIQGQTVHLEGEHVLPFVRTRQGVTNGSNQSRMRRHRTYLNALMTKYKAEIKENSGILNEAYKRVEPFIYSNLSMAELTNIAAKCATYSGGKIETTKGTVQLVKNESDGALYNLFYIDKAALKTQVERLFY